MLEARHQGGPAGRRLERVERHPAAPIADRMDLGRDPGRRRPASRMPRPRPASVSQIPRSVPGGSGRPGLGLDRLEERGRPRRQRPVGEQLQPAEPCPAAGRSRADRRSAAPARPPSPAAPSGSRHGPGSAGRRARRATRYAAIARPRPSWSDSAPGSWTATTPSRIRSRASRAIEVSYCSADAGGTWSVTIRAAASWRTPVGVPSASRRMIPPAGIALDRRRCPRSPSPAGSPTGRGDRGPTARPPGRARPARDRRRSARRPSDRCASRGPRARRPGRRAPRGPRRSGPARRRASGSPSGRSGRATSPPSARWRWASVRPGIATSSGSSSIRKVCGSARVSSSMAEPANATRPSVIPTASTQPNPRSPARVAIRPPRDEDVERHQRGHPVAIGVVDRRRVGEERAPGRRGRARRRARAPGRSAPSGPPRWPAWIAPARTHVAPPPGNA